LVFDRHGYLRLTDYGIAREWNPDNNTENSGTPGYMAPEVMCAQNHTIAVDYFALGVFAFELMYGFRPYTGKSRSEIKLNYIQLNKRATTANSSVGINGQRKITQK
jgi:serine/threonine protein kinase